MIVLRVQRCIASPGKVGLASHITPISYTPQRAYHDLITLPSAGKAVVSHGPPGYSAVSGHTVTVFGCTGFLGRYLVSKIGERLPSRSYVCRGRPDPLFPAKMGTQVIVPYRDEDEARHLKPMGDLGQIVPMVRLPACLTGTPADAQQIKPQEWDIRSDEQIAECVRHSDIVYNLVGRDYETK